MCIRDSSKKRNKLACATVRNIVKVHCNVPLVDNIETIGHSDANIAWSSSNEDLDWLAGVNFYKLYFKIFELHNNGLYFILLYMYEVPYHTTFV